MIKYLGQYMIHAVATIGPPVIAPVTF